MALKKRSPGCPCCTGGGPLGHACTVGDGICIAPNRCICETVHGCNSAGIPGVTIVFTQGANTWTGTTDGAGSYCICALDGASITATVSGVPRFASANETWVVGTAHATLFLTPLAGYTCLACPGGGGGSGQGCSPYPIANTLHWSDTCNGAITLTYGGGVWTGSSTVGPNTVTITAFITGGATCGFNIAWSGPGVSYNVNGAPGPITCGNPTGFMVSGTYVIATSILPCTSGTYSWTITE